MKWNWREPLKLLLIFAVVYAAGFGLAWLGNNNYGHLAVFIMVVLFTLALIVAVGFEP